MSSGCVILTCDGCNIQLMTRSGKSDQLVRDLPKLDDDAPANVAAPAPVPTPAARTEAHAPAPVKTPTEIAPVPVRTEKRSPFSMLGA